MQQQVVPRQGLEHTDKIYEVAAELLEKGNVSSLAQVFAILGPDHDFTASTRGAAILADILYLLLEELNLKDPETALAAMEACSPSIAQQGYDLLLHGICPDGALVDPAELDDAAILCFALLQHVSGQGESAKALLRRASAGRTSLYFFRAAGAIAERFVNGSRGRDVFKPKLIIWDLDDTLWQGTLAEGEEPVLNERRAEFVRTLNRCGIVSAICSKNDLATARASLEDMGLWEEFVFPRIAFQPKGQVVRQLVSDMQLRPVNVLFLDDNPHNLHEVAQAVPGIRVMDARSPECDALLQQIVTDHDHITKSRIAYYRMLEIKVAERGEKASDDKDFLVHSDIHATYVWRMDNLEFADRIEELINRSNQLNYMKSRVSPEEVARYILDISHYYVVTAFVWDRYGYYGLAGVAIFDFHKRRLEHLAFSCRIMHMGIEAFLVEVFDRNLNIRLDSSDLRKPLPPQTADAISYEPYENEAVRARILAKEAPRDWSAITLRVMADCQSGAFHHYSRFRDVMDYDNCPRFFSLPMMLSGECDAQRFPPYLVYAAATDYASYRWEERLPEGMDDTVVYAAIGRFVDMVVAGGRKCLLLLPPEEAPVQMFNLHKNCDSVRMHRAHLDYNRAWRDIVTRHSAHFALIELADMLTQQEMSIHLHHYVPSTLKRIASMIDDWYARESVERVAEKIAE